ncbi:MAG: GxxExxY protein [Lentisphaerae bacterium]|nr:GxxExxY protein [Lentisphaerota bacterium]
MEPTKNAKGHETEERPELIYRKEAYRIVGACFEVYKGKGCGFLEPVYQECLEIEFRLQEIPVVAQRNVALKYKGEPLKHTYACRPRRTLRALPSSPSASKRTRKSAGSTRPF